MAGFRELERPAYFSGELLTADDFRLAQDYVLDRLRRRNRLLPGWGVVTGLRVSIDPSPTPTAVIAPGVAIDCAGNEIVVVAEVRLSLVALDGPRYAVVGYQEMPIDPVPVGDGMAFARIREGASVALVANNPNAGHRGIGPGTPGCGDPHPVCVATLGRTSSRWVVRSAWRGTGARRVV